MRETQKKMVSTKNDLANVQAGTKTMTTLFKNKDDTTSMANKVEQYDREIAASQRLSELILVYLAEKVIPTWKREHLAVYTKILTSFQVSEIQNCHANAGVWSRVLQNEKLRSVKV